MHIGVPHGSCTLYSVLCTLPPPLLCDKLNRMLKTILKAGLILTLLLVGTTAAFARNYKTQGKASYYADFFDGRLTSNGEIFSQDSLTCAHRTLPFGTYLKVTNPKNNQEVIVRVNDRGPFIDGRVIDLSRAAAEQLDMIHAGVVRVDIVQVEKPVYPEVAPFEIPLFQMYDELLKKCYTLEEWHHQREEDRISLIEASIKDTISNYIAEADLIAPRKE